jgi:hypothetical protein
VIDLSPGDWIVADIGAFGSGVGGVVAAGFEAYARVLHPAWTRDGEPVSWAEVAAWSGRTIHPTVQFETLAQPRRGADHGPAPWDGPPRAGELGSALLSALCDLLSRHTGTTRRCWFCLWDGYGWIDGSFSGATIVAWRGRTPDATARQAAIPPAFPPAVIDGPRLRLPERDYIVFAGPLDAAAEMGQRVDGAFFPQSPNLFWPDDRAWCVATEIDLDSTYIGGPAALVDELLNDPRIEALPADLADPVSIDSDDVNR